MRKVLFLFMAMGIFCTASSQFMVGASIGTYNIPGAGNKFKGIGPTIKVEYGMTDRQSSYLDASLYNKEEYFGETTITNSSGAVIGRADTKVHYSIKHLQLGLKRIFVRDWSDKGLALFFGGGIAVSQAKTTYKYTLPGYEIPDDKFSKTIFGFHFNAGVQYNLAPVIIELKGTLDIMIKPLVRGDSYVMSTTRLGVLIPLKKQ